MSVIRRWIALAAAWASAGLAVAPPPACATADRPRAVQPRPTPEARVAPPANTNAAAHSSDGGTERKPTPTTAQSTTCPPRGELALAALTYIPKERNVDLWLAPLSGEPPVRTARLRRAADTPVSGIVLPGTDTVVAVISPRRTRDLTWSGELTVVSKDGPSRVLLRNVHAGVTPVASSTGTVYAVRGVAGPEREEPDPSPGYRRDKLELVAVEARSGNTRVLAKGAGDAILPIGLFGDELIVYRVGVEPAAMRTAATTDLVAVDTTTGSPRTLLASAPALARDFSLDVGSRKLWFTAVHDSDPQKSHRDPSSDNSGRRDRTDDSANVPGKSGTAKDHHRAWAVYLLDLQSQALTVVAQSSSIGLTPHLFPGGKVAYSCTRGGASDSWSSLCVQSADDSGPSAELHPLGGGRHEIRHVACTAEGSIAFGVYDPADNNEARPSGQRPAPFSIPFAWDPVAPRGQRLGLPPGRVVFAGTVPSPRPADRRQSQP